MQARAAICLQKLGVPEEETRVTVNLKCSPPQWGLGQSPINFFSKLMFVYCRCDVGECMKFKVHHTWYCQGQGRR